MLSSSSTIRTGQYAETIHGVGLVGSDLQSLRDQRSNAAALGQAIREALQRARDQGLGAFAPDSGTLQVPSVPLDDLRALFSTVLRTPYCEADEAPGLPDYGPLSLGQWSEAEATLAVQVARDDSMLSPGQGGGPHYARGRWYINGEPYTTAEVFFTVRMGNLGGLDQELASNLDVLVANTQLARDLLSVLADMARRDDLRQAQAEAAGHGATGPVFQGHDDFTVFVEAAGRTVPEVMDLGRRFKGDDSALFKVGALALVNANVLRTDYRDAMTELQALFDSINTENDVKKLRVDSLHNTRMNLLEGLSSYLDNAQQQGKTVGHNLR